MKRNVERILVKWNPNFVALFYSHFHYAVSNGLMTDGDIIRYEGGEQSGGWITSSSR